ncbi:hypothetical protein [Paraburkholderia lacunae]|uniref:hypothetical protein n=1 Tax=Paraburkholderia lacunae TaxID=2211104 RepID=UPI001402AC37
MLVLAGILLVSVRRRALQYERVTRVTARFDAWKQAHSSEPAARSRSAKLSCRTEKTRPLRRKYGAAGIARDAAAVSIKRRQMARGLLAGEARQHAGQRGESRVDMFDGEHASTENQAGLRLRALMKRRETLQADRHFARRVHQRRFGQRRLQARDAGDLDQR